MRVGLHWKILIVTVVPIAALTGAVLWTVNRSISKQAQRITRDDLLRAAATFEDMLASRAEELAVASQVIVQDPKFFAVLTLPAPANDPQARATAEGVAADFNAITHADLFVLFDANGRVVASAGREGVSRREWRPLVGEALDGRPQSVILADANRHFQAIVAPVRAGGRVVGALLLGARIGQDLAERLRSLTRSDVTFLSGGVITGSTLDQSDDRRRLADLLARDRRAGHSPAPLVFEFPGARTIYVTIAREIPGSAPDEGQLYVMQRSLEAETAFLGPMRLTLAEIGLLALVVSLTVGYLISRGITAPVRTLVRGAEEMERGNYDYPLDVRSRDEIGYLALRFRDMRRQQQVYVKSLEEVARLKGDFVDVASHELRTPISILKGFLELLAQERLGPLNRNQREAVTAMERGVATLTRVAEDASRLAQIQSERLVLSPGSHGARALLEEAAKLARVVGAGRAVAVQVEAAADLEPVIVDGPHLVEAIYQLVCNGIRFTPDGGSVMVRAERDGSELVVQVQDTGTGIPPEKLTRLLQRSLVIRDSLHHHSSSTLEFNSAGLGLGLPIARGVAEAHGGRLTVRSTPEAGSVFTLRLPARWAPVLEEAA